MQRQQGDAPQPPPSSHTEQGENLTYELIYIWNIWDYSALNTQIMKTFLVPRGCSVCEWASSFMDPDMSVYLWHRGWKRDHTNKTTQPLFFSFFW